jgi:hypothetical protein
MIHPEQCKRCAREYSVQETGPDAGHAFVCGMMVECGGCDGTYYVPKPCAPIEVGS